MGCWSARIWNAFFCTIQGSGNLRLLPKAINLERAPWLAETRRPRLLNYSSDSVGTVCVGMYDLHEEESILVHTSNGVSTSSSLCKLTRLQHQYGVPSESWSRGTF